MKMNNKTKIIVLLLFSLAVILGSINLVSAVCRQYDHNCDGTIAPLEMVKAVRERTPFDRSDPIASQEKQNQFLKDNFKVDGWVELNELTKKDPNKDFDCNCPGAKIVTDTELFTTLTDTGYISDQPKKEEFLKNYGRDSKDFDENVAKSITILPIAEQEAEIETILKYNLGSDANRYAFTGEAKEFYEKRTAEQRKSGYAAEGIQTDENGYPLTAPRLGTPSKTSTNVNNVAPDNKPIPDKQGSTDVQKSVGEQAKTDGVYTQVASLEPSATFINGKPLQQTLESARMLDALTGQSRKVSDEPTVIVGNSDGTLTEYGKGDKIGSLEITNINNKGVMALSNGQTVDTTKPDAGTKLARFRTPNVEDAKTKITPENVKTVEKPSPIPIPKPKAKPSETPAIGVGHPQLVDVESDSQIGGSKGKVLHYDGPLSGDKLLGPVTKVESISTGGYHVEYTANDGMTKAVDIKPYQYNFGYSPYKIEEPPAPATPTPAAPTAPKVAAKPAPALSPQAYNTQQKVDYKAFAQKLKNSDYHGTLTNLEKGKFDENEIKAAQKFLKVEENGKIGSRTLDELEKKEKKKTIVAREQGQKLEATPAQPGSLSDAQLFEKFGLKVIMGGNYNPEDISHKGNLDAAVETHGVLIKKGLNDQDATDLIKKTGPTDTRELLKLQEKSIGELGDLVSVAPLTKVPEKKLGLVEVAKDGKSFPEQLKQRKIEVWGTATEDQKKWFKDNGYTDADAKTIFFETSKSKTATNVPGVPGAPKPPWVSDEDWKKIRKEKALNDPMLKKDAKDYGITLEAYDTPEKMQEAITKAKGAEAQATPEGSALGISLKSADGKTPKTRLEYKNEIDAKIEGISRDGTLRNNLRTGTEGTYAPSIGAGVQIVDGDVLWVDSVTKRMGKWDGKKWEATDVSKPGSKDAIYGKGISAYYIDSQDNAVKLPRDARLWGAVGGGANSYANTKSLTTAAQGFSQFGGAISNLWGSSHPGYLDYRAKVGKYLTGTGLSDEIAREICGRPNPVKPEAGAVVIARDPRTLQEIVTASLVATKSKPITVPAGEIVLEGQKPFAKETTLWIINMQARVRAPIRGKTVPGEVKYTLDVLPLLREPGKSDQPLLTKPITIEEGKELVFKDKAGFNLVRYSYTEYDEFCMQFGGRLAGFLTGNNPSCVPIKEIEIAVAEDEALPQIAGEAAEGAAEAPEAGILGTPP